MSHLYKQLRVVRSRIKYEFGDYIEPLLTNLLDLELTVSSIYVNDGPGINVAVVNGSPAVIGFKFVVEDYVLVGVKFTIHSKGYQIPNDSKITVYYNNLKSINKQIELAQK